MDANGKHVIRELEPGRWVLEFVTKFGSASGFGTYPTAEVAAEEAKRRNADLEIEIRPLRSPET